MAVKFSKAKVIVTADTKGAQNAIEQLKAAANDLKSQIATLEAQGKKGSKEWNKYVKNLASCESAIKQSEREFASLDSVLKNMSGSSFRQLNKAYNQLTQQIKTHSRETKEDRAEIRKKIRDLKKLEKEMHKISGMWKTQDGAIASVMKRLTAYVAVYGGFNMIVGKVTQMASKNLEFADSISDIQKVSGLTQKEVEKLTGEIAKIDSRNSQQELDRLAYAAGKLGIGTRDGAKGILEFTKAADKLQVALKEYLGEDGVVSLMKVADVMGDTKKFGVEQALLKTGSAVNYMTQSTAAAADYMVDFLSRTGGMAKAANITTPELVGLASTLDSLSQNVEVSGTTMNKFFAQLMTHYGKIAEATGISKDWIKTTLEQGKTMEVVMTIFDKLGDKGGLSALGLLFKDLGLDGARLMQVMTQLANNSDRVRQYVAMSNKAFKEGTSVTQEYAIKNENAAAIMERMKNSWDKMFVNAQNTGVMKDIAQDLYDVSKELQNNQVWVKSLSLAFKTLITALEWLIRLLPAIINGFTAMKIAQLTAAVWRFVPAIWGATGALTALQAVNPATWIGLAIGGITLLVSWFGNMASEAEKAAKKVDELGEHLKKVTADVETDSLRAKREVDKLFSSLQKENLTRDEKNAILGEINQKYGTYIGFLVTENTKASDIAKAWDDVNKKLRANIVLKAKQAQTEAVAEKYMKREGDAIASLENTLEDRIGNDKNTKKGNRAVDVTDNILKRINSDVENAKKKGGDARQITRALMQSSDVKNNLKKGDMSDQIYNLIATGNLSRDAYANAQMQKAEDAARTKAKNGRLEDSEIIKTRQKAATAAEKDWNEINNVREQVYNIATAQIMAYKDTKKVEKYFSRLIKPDYVITEDPNANKFVITEDTSKEDAKAAREAAAKQRKELAAMRKEAYEELKGIKSIITAFYEQREAEIQADFEAGMITEVKRMELLNENGIMRAQSMIDAWNVMLKKPGAEAVWAERLKAMEGQIYGGSQEMEITLEDISKRNLVQTGKLLDNFGTSMQDGLKKTVAQNEKIIEQHLSKVRETIHKALLEYDYVYSAFDKARKTMSERKVFKLSQGTIDGIQGQNALADAQPKFVIKKTSVEEVEKKTLEQINGNYQKMFSININTDEGVQKFADMMSKIVGLSEDCYTRLQDKQTKNFLETEEDYKNRMKLFYQSIMDMGEGVEQAQDKARKEWKTSFDRRYEQDPEKIKNDEDQKDASMNIKNNSHLGSLGLDSAIEAANMEIRLYELKMEAAVRYYERLKAENADQILQKEAQIAMDESIMELTDKLIEKQMEKLSVIKELGDKVETFGEEFGEAIDGSLEDRQAAFKNLIKGFGDVTKKMVMEWVKQRIQQSINNRLMKVQQKLFHKEEIVEEKAQSIAKQGIKSVEGATMEAIQTTTNTKLEADQQAHDQKEISEQGTKTSSSVSLSLAEAFAKCFGTLGPIAGAVSAAVVSAAISAILAWAMSKIGKSSGSAPDTASTTKLASGMLTYDQGNVQMFRALDNGTVASVLASDGQTYNARVVPKVGTGIVSSPIATMINGQPSVVGERGAEMVIGRQTFAAMQSLRPDLVQQIVSFDKYRSGMRFKAYDDGNVGEIMGDASPMTGAGGDSAQMMALLSSNRDTNVALVQAISGLNAQLAAGIGVRKFGAGGVVDEVADGFAFLKGKGSNVNIKRLFN